MFDDIQPLGEAPLVRWPLHPAPAEFETLDHYLRRLAENYGTSVRTFCRYGLGQTMDIDELAANPPRFVLERLSAGTGTPIATLRNMTTRRAYARVHIALRAYVRRRP